MAGIINAVHSFNIHPLKGCFRIRLIANGKFHSKRNRFIVIIKYKNSNEVYWNGMYGESNISCAIEPISYYMYILYS